MYGVVRDNTFDAANLAAGTDAVAAFRAIHASQPGYCGSLVVDAGHGRQLSVTLWRTQAEAEAARDALGPVIGRTLEPLMAKASILVGVGEVVFDDMSPSAEDRQTKPGANLDGRRRP